MKRRTLRWVAMIGLAVSASPGAAAVDLFQRLVDKGILTEQERQELAKESDAKTRHRGKSFSWATDDDRFRLELYGYGQVRYTLEDREAADNKSDFTVQRARFGLRGHALTNDLTYNFLVNVYGGNEEKTELFAYYVDYSPWEELGVTAGQFKVPYAAQWNISATSQQFVERTQTDANFRFDYDTGLAVHGKPLGFLTCEVGLFNGEGKNKKNPDDGHLWVGRVSVEPLGKYPLHESDNEISRKPVVLLSAAVAFNDDVASHTRSNLNGRLTALGKSDVTSYNGFVGAKFMGASAQAEYHRRKIEPDDAKEDETAVGFYAQGGYFLWQDTIEAAVRYEYFDPNDDDSDDLRQEYGVGLNCFFAAHRNKVQADFFRVNTQKGADSTDDNRFRVQYQLAF